MNQTIYDTQIALIRQKIDKERKNLLDSGFLEGSDEFETLMLEIESAYRKDILRLAVLRHASRPFEADELAEHNWWLEYLFDASVENPPSEFL
jgi:hypothetical protein